MYFVSLTETTSRLQTYELRVSTLRIEEYLRTDITSFRKIKYVKKKSKKLKRCQKLL